MLAIIKTAFKYFLQLQFLLKSVDNKKKCLYMTASRSDFVLKRRPQCEVKTRIMGP